MLDSNSNSGFEFSGGGVPIRNSDGAHPSQMEYLSGPWIHPALDLLLGQTAASIFPLSTHFCRKTGLWHYQWQKMTRVAPDIPITSFSHHAWVLYDQLPRNSSLSLLKKIGSSIKLLDIPWTPTNYFLLCLMKQVHYIRLPITLFVVTVVFATVNGRRATLQI